jgi:hypothetical protein
MYRHYLTKIHSGAVIATCVVFGCLLGALALLLEMRLMYGLFPQSQLDNIPKRNVWNSLFGEFAVWFDLHLSPWLFPQLLLDDPATSYYTPWFFKFGAYATAVCIVGAILGGIVGYAISLGLLGLRVRCARVCWFGGWWAAIITVFLLADYGSTVSSTKSSLISLLLFVQLFIGAAMLIRYGSQGLKKHGLLDN